jgi:DNA polymerase-1
VLTQIDAYNLLLEGSLALSHVEQAGIRLDMNYLESKIKHMDRQQKYMDRKFKESKFYAQWNRFQDKEPNPNSAAQLRNFLYGVRKLNPLKETEKGLGSVDKESLAALNIPELNMLLEYRQLKKKQDYLLGFQREQIDGWLHPNFNLHLVKTYRSSADRPNLQNIPKRDKEAMQLTRRALFPREGHQILEVDYGALEVRVAACYHKDPTMIKYLEDGFDMHADMTKQLFIIDDFDKHRPDHAYLRGATKNGFVFPQFYGDYFRNCAKNMACEWGKLSTGGWKPGQGVDFEGGKLSDHLISQGIKSLRNFTDHVEAIEQDFWGKRFRVYAKWKETWWHQYQKNGYVDLLTGFRCSGLMGKNVAINYPIQGSAFHCLLWSLIKLDKFIRREGLKSRIIGQIHDSLVLDIFPEEMEGLIKAIKKITTLDLPKAWDWIIVPLEIDFEYCEIDKPWSEKKELNIS